MAILLQIQAESLVDGLLLRLSGPLGREGGESLLRLVQEQPNLPRRLVIDFGRVAHMNTAGIGGVLWAVRLVVKDGGQVLAFGLTEHFRKVFHVMGLTQYITVVDDEGASLR